MFRRLNTVMIAFKASRLLSQRSATSFKSALTPYLIGSLCKGQQQSLNKQFIHQIVEEGIGTHKPTAFEKKILVWEKMYPSADKIPERVKRSQIKKALDKFRVRVSIIMIACTFVSAAVVAMVGRKERQEGKTLTKMVLERTEKLKSES